MSGHGNPNVPHDCAGCTPGLDVSRSVEMARAAARAAAERAHVEREQAVVARVHRDEQYVRESFRRARDPLILRLRKTLPTELGGRRTSVDPWRAERDAAMSACDHLREAGLLGDLSRTVLREAWGRCG